MKKSHFQKARGLVTGASSGIGRALCVELARLGTNLVVTARREDRLHDLALELNAEYGVSVVTVAGDLTAEKTRQAVLDAARIDLGGLNFLINNAGAGATERIEATSEDTARRLFELNFFAPLLLTRSALPLLKETAASSGLISTVVNFGSIVGLRGTPHYGVYGAAKAALINLSDALRAESAGEGVNVLTVSPGTTSSEFFDNLWENRSMPNFPSHRAATPERVAQAVVRAMIRGRHRVLPHGPSKILDLLQRISPWLTDQIMARYR